MWRPLLALALVVSPFVSVDDAAAEGSRVEDPIVGFTFVVGAPNLYAQAPAPLRIKVGDTMVWTNRDPVPHDVSFETIPFADYLPPGESAELTFTEPGQFKFHCHAHAEYPNMYGLVFVE